MGASLEALSDMKAVTSTVAVVLWTHLLNCKHDARRTPLRLTKVTQKIELGPFDSRSSTCAFVFEVLDSSRCTHKTTWFFFSAVGHEEMSTQRAGVCIARSVRATQRIRTSFEHSSSRSVGSGTAAFRSSLELPEQLFFSERGRDDNYYRWASETGGLTFFSTKSVNTQKSRRHGPCGSRHYNTDAAPWLQREMVRARILGTSAEQ